MPNPLVSAICLTGKTPFHVDRLLPQAIRCFLDQSYPNKELLLVTELPELDIPADLFARAAGTIHMISAPQAKCVGELRNAGLDAARGPLVIQWDDDDWHHPERITTQVIAWDNARRPVFLQRQLAYSFLTDTAFVREFKDGFIHGTVLHEVLPSVRYPSIHLAEDTEFINQFPEVAIVDNDPCLYVRLSHGQNNWDDKHIMREAAGRKGEWLISREQADALSKVLRGYDLVTASLLLERSPAAPG